MSFFTEVLQQMFFYLLVVFITIQLTGFFMAGFFWKYTKVRLSFGRKVLIKIKSLPSDKFRIGWVEENFLIVKDKKKPYKRIAINDKSVFYRAAGITMVDMDEDKNALLKPNYEAVTGFDAVRHSNLVARALTAPQRLSKNEKILMAIGVFTLLATIAAVGMVFLLRQDIVLLKDIIGQVAQGAVVAGGGF